MKQLHWKSSALILTSLCAVCMLARPVAAQSYLVTDLGTISGPGGFTQAFGINNSGQVVGATDTSQGLTHPFLWTPAVPNGMTGSLKDLGVLSQFTISNQANAINDAGVVVGFAGLDNGNTHAVSFTNGVLKDLGVLPNFNLNSNATAINKSGQIVGVSAGTTIEHAFLCSAGKMTDLGTLPGGVNSTASGINAVGEIVGEADNAVGTFVPFLFVNGVMHDMSGPGGLPGTPKAINDAGQVTGVLAIPIIIPDPGNPEPGVLLHAYLWTPATPNGLTGTFQDLGAIGSASVGAALNASGEVVGNDGGFQTHAFLFRNGAVLDLNSLIPGNSGVTLSTANGINDAGQIAACGMIGLNFHAFLLTPTTGPVLPSAPTLLLATAGNASVTLTWQASVMATTYNVKRATSNAGPFTTIATVNAPTTQFVDKTAQNGVGYYYTVSSVNSVGESPNSLLAFAFPLPGPTNLTATAGTRQIVLNWKQPAGLAVNANIICRSCNGGQFMPIAAIKPTTTFTDKTVVPGLTYSYQVVATAAKFGSRQTPPSNTATATAH